MINLLLKLMAVAAIMQLGFSVHEAFNCKSSKCSSRIERASRDVLNIEWKPISIWPELNPTSNKPVRR